MSEEKIARYIELVETIKQNNKEMKAIKAEKKLIEEEIIESGETEFSYYGTKITITPKTSETLVKEEVEALIAREIKKSEQNGDGLSYEDFYEQKTSKKISIKEQKFNNKTGEVYEQ